jgi:hypothetical protein
MGRACSTKREMRIAYKILVGKPEGKRPLGRPRRRWVDTGVTNTFQNNKLRWPDNRTAHSRPSKNTQDSHTQNRE